MKALFALGTVTALSLASFGDALAASPSSPAASPATAPAPATAVKSAAAPASAQKSAPAANRHTESAAASPSTPSTGAKPASGARPAPAHAPHGKTAGRARSGGMVPERTLEERPAKGALPGLKASKDKAKPPCFRDAVTIVHFAEEDTFPLTRCDGSVAHLAVERLSVLSRPGSAAKPGVDPSDLAKVKGNKLAPGIRRIDAKLVERIQSVVDHFSKGKHARLQLISGYRPASAGSYHATGRALDMRIDGVSNEALIAYCKTLPDTGCGYYPNSSFIHIDVREPGTGHVTWIDASGPGESPRYVSAWPPPAASSPASPNTPPPSDESAVTVEDALAKLDRLFPPLPADEHTTHMGEGKIDDDDDAPAAPSKPAAPSSEKKSEGLRYQR
ncbi:YcbK family protein [Pendulispora albinea]|uniref:DUF882 domain-containing protein n=1 Tax=Pendulispora albinea TaxID=2741071 RepID=A0ABZ2LSF5_9BACT